MEAAPVIMATAAPATTAMWFPEQISVASYQAHSGGGAGAVRKSAVGGAFAGLVAAGPGGAVVGGLAAATAASVATPNMHIEYKLLVTIQGMQLERNTRWSACETLCAKMKDHALPEVKLIAEQLPAKYWSVSGVDHERIQKRAAQLGAFFGDVCRVWRDICNTHGPASQHAQVFNAFFELPGHTAGQSAMLNTAPFVTQPAVGADFGDWRVSGGELSLQQSCLPRRSLLMLPYAIRRNVSGDGTAGRARRRGERAVARHALCALGVPQQ
eukprot:COSAG02_NODE_506_length_20931_cov_20.533218_9_plen_270_part_00